MEDLVFTKVGNSYHYNRSSNNELDLVRTSLMEKYGASDCIITSSGMSAISSVLHTLCMQPTYKKINLVYSSELYQDSPRLFDYLCNVYPGKIFLHKFDVCDSVSVVNLFQTFDSESTNILFVESCSNPNSHMFDFSIIPILRKSKSIIHVIIDNTWLTSEIFNPIDHGADFVVTSLTKYYSGGTAIAGAIIGTNIWMSMIFDWIRINGVHTSPHNCKVIGQNLSLMSNRVKQSSDLTTTIIDQLKSNSKIVSINHPYIKSHSTHELYHKIISKSMYPSVFTIGISTSKNKALKAMEKSTIIEHKTSFGGKTTRTDPWPISSNGIVYCRISVGYDDANTLENIIKGINDMVDSATVGVNLPAKTDKVDSATVGVNLPAKTDKVDSATKIDKKNKINHVPTDKKNKINHVPTDKKK
jgi:cystathionine beta-lyase/cystathionine gamma-synthase